MGWRGWMVFAALGVIWGLPYFFIKLAVQEVSPFALAFCRVGLAAAILLPIAWRRGSLQSLRRHKFAIVAFSLAEFASSKLQHGRTSERRCSPHCVAFPVPHNPQRCQEQFSRVA